jgi:hypothetical protein
VERLAQTSYGIDMNVDVRTRGENVPPSSPTPADSGLLRLPIDAGHVMMFARALGERVDSPDEVANRDIPTTFPVALAQFDPNYELRPRPDQPWFGSGAEPGMPRTSSEPRTRLHAEQHFEYQRRVKPGEVLTARRRPGCTWEKASSRGGVLTFTESFIDFTDAAGELVLTSRSVSVFLPIGGEQGR